MTNDTIEVDSPKHKRMVIDTLNGLLENLTLQARHTADLELKKSIIAQREGIKNSIKELLDNYHV
jgi:hypothetical protein